MKRIILRLDLNVPIEYDGDKQKKILETERIDAVIPEIKKLANKNKVIILSHLGKGESKETLKNIIEKYIRKNLSQKESQNVEIIENVRFQKGETAKINSKEFLETSKYFASIGDEYIDDAFATMHRPHASIVGIPKIFKKQKRIIKIGELSKIEIKNISRSINLAKNEKNKTLLILSGAKISTKLPLVEKFLNIKNTKIFVGGGIANQILKDILNKEIGSSLFEKDFTFKPNTKKIILKAIKEKRLLLPYDVILNTKEVETIDNIKNNNEISDIGPVTFTIIKNEIMNSSNIIVNGPLGIYEKGFISGTTSILKLLKNSKANILIGGGDLLVFAKKLKINSTKNIFVSTGGGAMLTFLADNGKLPGIEVLK